MTHPGKKPKGNPVSPDRGVRSKVFRPSHLDRKLEGSSVRCGIGLNTIDVNPEQSDRKFEGSSTKLGSCLISKFNKPVHPHIKLGGSFVR